MFDGINLQSGFYSFTFFLFFILNNFSILFCIIFLVICSLEIYFKSQRTSAKIYPEKTEMTTDNYVHSNNLNINPMFITIK